LGHLGNHEGFEVLWNVRNVEYRSGVSIVADGRYMVAKGMKFFLWFSDFLLGEELSLIGKRLRWGGK